MKRIVFILLLVALVFSCDLFNATLDPDYWERIDVEIAYANAPLINVQVSSGGMGTASPSGSQQVKLWQEAFSKYGYAPFTVSYQPFSQYPFTGWQAWYSGQEPFATWKPGTEEDGLPEEEGQDKVEFKSADETGTHIFIYINKLPEEEGIIHIGPLGADTDVIEVRTLADNRWGTVFSSQIINTKAGFPFTVEFSPSGSWDFLGWKAYLYNNQTADNLNPHPDPEIGTLGAELPPQDVTINVTGVGRATITVNTDKPVLLVPLCVTPVRVNFSTPPNGSPIVYAPSQDISITFSTQLDPNTVKFGEGFFQIMGQSDGAPFDINAHYLTPVYMESASDNDRSTVTIAVNPDDPLTADTVVMVTVGTEVKGKYGNSLNVPAEIRFSVSLVGGITTKTAYEAVDVSLLHDPSQYSQGFIQQWDGSGRDRRIRLNNSLTEPEYEVTLYFGVRAVGDIDNDVEHGIEITEIHYARLDGEDMSDAFGLVVDEVRRGSAQGRILEMSVEDTQAEQAYRAGKPADLKFYKAVYRWTNPVDGIIRLVVLPSGEQADAEDWRTVVAESRGYITVAFDNLAPGGTETATLSGEGTQSVESGLTIYNYNETASVMTADFNFRNIRDNYEDGFWNGNLNATGGKPRTMDAQADVQWQWRIVTGAGASAVQHYPANNDVWRSIYNSSDESFAFAESVDLTDCFTVNVNTVRYVQVRYRDALGNGAADDGWKTVGFIRYYTPPIDPVPLWSVAYNASNGSYSVDWTAETDMQGLEISVNGGQWQAVANDSKPFVLPNINMAINTSNARNDMMEAAVETVVRVRSYNGSVRQAELAGGGYPQVRIFNSVGMTITSARQANGSYSVTTGGVPVIVVDNSNKGTAFDAANRNAVFLLAESVDLGAHTPIGTGTGTGTNAFSGRFYGNGHTITISSFGESNANRGLFGVASNAVIRDLTVAYNGTAAIGVVASAEYSIGGIVGSASGSTQIINCIVRGTNALSVNGTGGTANIRIGGIAGYFAGSGKIENCRASLSVSYSSSGHTGEVRIGGVAGETGAGNTAVTFAINNGYTNNGNDFNITQPLINGVTVAANVTANKNTRNGVMSVGGAVGRSERNTMNDIEFTAGTVSFNRTITSSPDVNNIGGIVGNTVLTNINESKFYGNIGTTTTAEVTGDLSIGGIVGRNDTNATGNYYINNCRTRMNLVIKSSGIKNIAGVLGVSVRTNGSIIITNTFFEGGNIDISGTARNFQIGGFTGFLNGIDQIFNNCGALSGTLFVDSSLASGVTTQVGGFISTSSASVNNCFSRIDIIVSATSSNSNYITMGGFMGRQSSTSAITNCYATGNVRIIQNGNADTSTNINVGGLVGWKSGTASISNSYALGNVIADKQSGSGRLHAGGLVGWNEAGNITNSFSTGQVTAQSNHTDGAYAGGLVGYLEAGNITNSAALGSSVTAGVVSGANVGAGRIAGFPTAATAIGSNNRANELMQTGTGAYITNSDPNYFLTGDISAILGRIASAVVPEENVSPTGRNGGDASIPLNFTISAFWQNTLGFSSTAWVFSTPTQWRGYPLLRGIDGQE